MPGLKDATSKRGVTCHTCHEWVRPGQQYFQQRWMEYSHLRYKNYCVRCADAHAQMMMITAKKRLKKYRQLVKIYNEDDRTICLNCKNKFKQVVGECNPRQEGCRPKPLKEKRRNDNKKS